MKLIGVDIETLKKKIAEADKLLIFMNNEFIESMKNPRDMQHLSLNLQIQEAAKGEKEVYLLCARSIDNGNFDLLMDMLKGSKLKTILFVDRDDEEDMDRAGRLVGLLMGPAKVSGTSRDAWRIE